MPSFELDHKPSFFSEMLQGDQVTTTKTKTTTPITELQSFDTLKHFSLESASNNLSSLERIKKRRLKLLREAQEIKNSVRPLEFETYYDYYLIHTFKKGVSVSGKVDIDGLRRRKGHGVYYKRIKRTSKNKQNEENGNDSSSDDESDHHKSGDEEYIPKSRTTRAQANKSTRSRNQSAQPPSVSPDDLSDQKTPSHLITGDITTDSIIPTSIADGTIRRSSRLSQKEKDALENKVEGPSEIEGEVTAEIHDLYESIVPKIPDPVRRSDWMLPNKYRYVPEKHPPVKHTPEQLKINDLIHNNRIRSVMSRFKGGLAGVRKKDWVVPC